MPLRDDLTNERVTGKLVQFNVKIDPQMDRDVRERAVRGGTTVSNIARQAFRDFLYEGRELSRIRLSLTGNEMELVRLRADLADSLEAVLLAVSSKGDYTEEQAREIINTRLRKRR